MSQQFTKTRKEAPADEVSKNAQLLIRAGFVYKEMAGSYVFLPLGLTVFNNIVQIVREEMNAIGGQELSMTALQRPEPWQASGRWSEENMDVWFKTKLANEQEIGLAPTHEEPITELMKQYIASYQDLPTYPYQFQTKFRNELRSKSGIMRGREFVMKDLYSFSKSQQEHDDFYELAKQAYAKVFERIGIGEQTFLTFASGGSFSKYSHEFQTICEAGEDIIYLDRSKNIAINEEVLTDEVLADLGLNRDDLEQVKAAEVGNIFSLGTKFSEPLGLKFTNEQGEDETVIMGSYGIGPARTMGVVTELLADDKGLIWPEAIAPAKYHLVRIGDGEEVVKAADAVYEQLQAKSSVLYDDRNARVGEMLNDADLIGIPTRIVISPKTIAANQLEVTSRATGETEMRSVDLNWV